MNHRCFSPQIQSQFPISNFQLAIGNWQLAILTQRLSVSIKIRFLAVAVFLASAAAGLGQPTFLFEPDSTSVSPGANVFFQSLAFGDGPITYQWFENGVELAGETEDFLFLAQATVADAG